jgi:hypothetical protein
MAASLNKKQLQTFKATVVQLYIEYVPKIFPTLRALIYKIMNTYTLLYVNSLSVLHSKTFKKATLPKCYKGFLLLSFD